MTVSEYSQNYKLICSANPPAKFFLCGDAQLFKDGMLRGAKASIAGTEEFNLDTFWMNDVKNEDGIKKIFDAILQFPMLGDRRVVILRNFSLGTGKTDICAKFIEKFEKFKFPASTLLVIESEKLDMRTKAAKFIASVFKIVELNTPDGEEVFGWIDYFAKGVGKRIDRRAAEKLVEVSGISVAALREEVRKIADFAESDVIRLEDVENAASQSKSGHVFQLADAVLRCDFEKAMRTTLSLIDFGESFSAILFWLNKSVNDLLWFRIDANGAQARFGKRYFVIRHVQSTAAKLDIQSICACFTALHEIDIMTKTSIIDDRSAAILAISHLSKNLSTRTRNQTT